MRPRRIAILSQFYPPEPCAAGNRVAALAAELRAHGNEVTVVTAFPSFPSGEIAPGYRGRRFLRERFDGIDVVRVWTHASPRLGARNRFLNWLSVALGAMLFILSSRRRFDVIVVSSPPITLALPAILGRIRHRAPLVADIRDVFPDVAVRIGEWQSGGLLARAVGFTADLLYRCAKTVVCVTESARREVAARGVPLSKIVVLPNGFDAVVPRAPDGFSRHDGEFVVAYVGNMGLATGLEVVIDAAGLLPEDRIRWLMIGGGADAARLRDRAVGAGIRNVEFLGVLPRGEAFGILEQADACVIPLRAALRDSIPTKMFDAMAVGCPILLSAAGEAADLLARSGAGIAVEPGSPRRLADGVLRLRDDAEQRRRFATSGERFVRENFDRTRIMSDYARSIAAL